MVWDTKDERESISRKSRAVYNAQVRLVLQTAGVSTRHWKQAWPGGGRQRLFRILTASSKKELKTFPQKLH